MVCRARHLGAGRRQAVLRALRRQAARETEGRRRLVPGARAAQVAVLQVRPEAPGEVRGGVQGQVRQESAGDHRSVTRGSLSSSKFKVQSSKLLNPKCCNTRTTATFLLNLEP